MQEREILQKMSNTIRFLATDMVQSANSGHPGAPMGLADIATVLTKHLKINPKNPKWMNRDRVVFSGGHASSLIYSLLHLWGFEDVTLDDLKNFRQLGYKTEGHPEANKLEGVEITTGPLGQGVANAVGFSMASLYMKKLLGEELIDHKVYCFCGDGDLEEGISYEASSLAGHLELKNLVLIYDSNRITIEGDTCKAWSENVQKRFEAQGFEVLNINGHNFDEIEEAFVKTKTQTKPILIIANTIIAKGSANLEGSHKTHGAPLGDTEIAESKKLAGFNPDEKFIITDDVLARFRATCERGDLFEREWNSKLKDSGKEAKLNSYLNSDFTEVEYPEFNVGDKVATRDSNGKILNAIAEKFENFLGGSADLGPSNKTELKSGSYPKGQNIHFGIREHSMGAIGNAIASYGGLFPFTATFFVFSDYLKPSVRIASLMGAKQFFIWTHDSIGVGEDGPTHQPIEHLSQFRAMPNLYNFRPADAVENVISWKVALELNAPSSFILSRQGLKVFDKSNIVGEVEKGGYLIKKVANPKLTLLASGSEVELILEAGEKLNEMGIATNIVSVPCFDLFNEQEKSYKDLIIDSNSKVLAVEASSSLEWYKYADECILMESFGASAKAEELFKLFGFTVENVIEKAKTLI